MRATRKAVVIVAALVAALVAAPVLPLQGSAAENSGARGERDAPVKTGEVAPDFTLAGQEGRRHTLSAERGKRPVVLVFYRGHW